MDLLNLLAPNCAKKNAEAYVEDITDVEPDCADCASTIDVR